MCLIVDGFRSSKTSFKNFISIRKLTELLKMGKFCHVISVVLKIFVRKESRKK